VQQNQGAGSEELRKLIVNCKFSDVFQDLYLSNIVTKERKVDKLILKFCMSFLCKDYHRRKTLDYYLNHDIIKEN